MRIGDFPIPRAPLRAYHSRFGPLERVDVESIEPRVRILVVDDHPIFRRGLLNLFRDQPDMSVVGEAPASSEAMALATETSPDVAMVDLVLGREDGLELVAALAERCPMTRAIVLSGHDEWLNGDRALRAGAAGYVMKDRGAEAILDAVRRVASGRTYFSAKTAGPDADATERSSERSRFERLSSRERQVFGLLGRGMRTREIATTMNLSPKTVETHCAHLKTKLGARSGRELVHLAVGLAERER